MFTQGFDPSSPRLSLSPSPIMSRYIRSASIAATTFGTVFNLALAVQVTTASWSIKWEPESEWEASSDSWQVDGVHVIWGLCCVHFALAAAVSLVGFIGILKRNSSLVRFYRDYSIADFSFCTFVTAIVTYAIFHTSARATICEGLSHHPEFLQNLMDMGLNLENCERWIERAGLAFVALMFIVLVIRLHFLLAVANLYSQLTGHEHPYSRSRIRLQDLPNSRRIYLLPPSDEEAQYSDDVEFLYAPIPISSVPKDVRDTATEAWVSCGTPLSADTAYHSRARSESCAHTREQQEQPQHPRLHRHRHHSTYSHRPSRSSSATRTGTIRLPILPDEGLLPGYHGISKA